MAVTSPLPSSAGPAIQPTGGRDEIKRLKEEIAEYRQSLDQWTIAEADWKRQSRLFRLMTENVSDLIVLVDRHGNRQWNNPAYSHLMGYDPSQIAGTNVLSEVHPDDQMQAHEAFRKAVENCASQQVEFRAQQKDGGWINLQTEIIPLGGANGEIEAVVVLAKDITEKEKLSEALALATTQVTAATMVESMARDFDQILTNTLGNLTIAKNLNGPHNAVAVRLNEIERAMQRARDIIEQMFSIAASSEHQKEKVALEPILHEAIGSVLRGTMVRAEYVFPRALPELEIDVEAFSHAIRNIVTNSLEAMDKGVVRITAEFLTQEQVSHRPDVPLKPGSYICLSLRDQGHGIPEKTLPRIFEPYFTTRPGSQGLGLTTALSTLQRMGGTITVDSTPSVGTTVNVYLPARAMEAPLTPLSATSALPRIGNVKKRILLMDDEQMILDIVSRMLTHLGYEVKTCTDGAQAIAAFAKAKSTGESFDVVLMDLVIPNGVGGQDAVHTIRKIDPHAKVIASSGHLDHAVMIEHKAHGFVASLEKPYKLERLQQVIEQVIEASA